MARKVSIGYQDFGELISGHFFYIDKTRFIKEWWESGDKATLITRPRRFGKTLTLSMLEYFFSLKYADQASLFQDLSIWKEEAYRRLQGTFPVISLTFANVKERSYAETFRRICQILTDLYNKHEFLLQGNLLTEKEKAYFQSVDIGMEETTASMALHNLSDYLSRYCGKKVLIFLDEYDTPLQEPYVSGYWDELAAFIRSLFNAAFKTNPYLERALLTGITRISKESIFSDLNNLEVITTTSAQYADAFGFTEEEVAEALKEYGLGSQTAEVKSWYDGFTFGSVRSIYNPWSIINYLDKGQIRPYWANTSSNSLAGELIRQGSPAVKEGFEQLLRGKYLSAELDEQIVCDQLSVQESSIWSLLLASGYLRAVSAEFVEQTGRIRYRLALTNREVRVMFETIIHGWFADSDSGYNEFVQALLLDDVKAMNLYMNRVALATFSFFDSGRRASAEKEPERFYHGFVLGLMVDLKDRYIITSNRESGFGRYDVMLMPKVPGDDAILLEFKVQDSEEASLADTVAAALAQVEQKQYAAALTAQGVPESRIRKYGFAFRGKQVLIGKA